MSDTGKRLDDMEARLEMAAPLPRYMTPGTTEFKNATATQANRDFFEDPASRAQPPTDKQVNYLSYLLGDHYGYKGLLAFVRFANGYTHGRLTRYHWIQAIELAKNGHNHYGNVRSLIQMSFDP